MKTSKTLLLAILFFTLISASCRKEKGIGDLPPETQIGANTFGCLVDGKVFIPRGSDGYSGTNIKAYYQYIYPSPIGYVFQFSATDYKKEPLEFVSIGIDSLKIIEGITYKIQNGKKGQFGASYWIGSNTQKTFAVVSPLNGEIFFKRFDEVNQIASGTFWFDAINLQGQNIKVTGGRFDVKFTR